MKQAVRPWLALSMALGLLLGGCVDGGQCFPAPQTTDVPRDAPASAGGLEASVRIRVRAMGEAGAAPVPGAAVVAMWAIPVESGVGEGTQAAIASIHKGQRSENRERLILVTAHLRTNGTGEVLLRLPSNALLQVAAAAANLTAEPSGIVGDTDALPAQVTVDLFHTTITRNFTASLPQGANPPNVRQYGSPHDLAWPGPDPAGYQARLARLDARLAWVNAATSQGDLALALGESRDSPHWYESQGSEFGMDGPHEVRLAVEDDDWQDWSQLTVQAAAGASVRVDPLAYDLDVAATFIGLGGLDEVCVPSDYVVHGPMEVAQFEAQARDEASRTARVWLGGAALLVVLAVVALALVLLRRPKA